MVFVDVVLGRELGHKGRALMRWISALTRRDPRKRISLLSAMSLYNEKMTIRKSARRLSPDTGSARTLIPKLPSLQKAEE